MDLIDRRNQSMKNISAWKNKLKWQINIKWWPTKGVSLADSNADPNPGLKPSRKPSINPSFNLQPGFNQRSNVNTSPTAPKPAKPSLSGTLDKSKLLNDIRQAHREWQAAAQRLDYVVEGNEIDYAIYAYEAAQKRYEMLLRQGKQINLNVLEIKEGEPR